MARPKFPWNFMIIFVVIIFVAVAAVAVVNSEGFRKWTQVPFSKSLSAGALNW